MSVTYHSLPQEFLDQCAAVLEQKESLNHILYCAALRGFGEKGFSFSLQGSAAIDIVGLIGKEGQSMMMSHARDQACIKDLAEFFAQSQSAINTIQGPAEEVSRFAEAWTELTGKQVSSFTDMIVYETDRIFMPQGVRGEMRPAFDDEFSLASRWVHAFSQQSMPKAEMMTMESAINAARKNIEAGHLYFWTIKDKPVAMTMITGQSVNRVRIGSVYTPIENRGQGYASALVAGLSQKLIDEGKPACCLNADARNPVSNAIYRKIGYEFTGRLGQYRF